MKNKENIDDGLICKLYRERNIGIESLAIEYHVGKKKIKEILERNGIAIKNRGRQNSKKKILINDWKITKYKEYEGSHYIAIDRLTGFETKDYMNRAGVLTTHISKEYNVEIPSLYDRREYYRETGNYWWEQWFDIMLVEDKNVKTCPYCGWKTSDVENKSGAFVVHLKREHGKGVEEYVSEYPDELDYFNKFKNQEKHKAFLEDNKNHVTCPICGEICERLTEAHMKNVHSMEWVVFKSKYPNVKVMSDNNMAQAKEAQKMANLFPSKNRFVSRYERELQTFLDENGIKYECNRQILIGREIDILIESKKLGIEFDGLKFHTEFFGRKGRGYHLEKTLKCNEKGYGLIHIFEDEYVNKKEIVMSKLRHAIGLDKNDTAIPGRKCSITPVNKTVAKDFLDKYHIQGFSKSSVYLGAFFCGELVAVMAFKVFGNQMNEYELIRYATKIGYKYQGVGGKLFKYFVRNHNPKSIISFADRRWTINKDKNLYTILGFELVSENAPDYRYYNERVERFQRVHKRLMTKTIMSKKYALPLTMTETEMAKSLGYDRIWDCGLLKYSYVNKNYIPGNESREW